MTDGGSTTVPSAPTGVSATPGDAEVTISWTASSGAAWYNIYWSSTSGVGKAGTKIPGVNSGYVQTGLTNGSTYYYVVTAVDSAGESAASSQAIATPGIQTTGTKWTGTWTDVSTTSGASFSYTAQITIAADGTFTWSWAGNIWGGTGTMSGSGWTMNASNQPGGGVLTATFSGTVSQTGSSMALTGNWQQSDGQVGTMTATLTVR